MNKENKPCPFCGSKDLYEGALYPSYIGCRDCNTEGPTAHSLKEAWEKWNKRSGEDDKHNS